MSKSTTKKVSRIKTRKKAWFKIFAPQVFGNKEIGETYLPAAENALGRLLKISLKDITGNVKDQNAYIGFKIAKAEGSALRTEVISYQLTPASVKRLVRKNTARLDDYFTFTTKDKKTVILKTLLITFNISKRSTEARLRKMLQDLLRAEITTEDFTTFLSNVVTNKVQATVRKKLNKIYPLKEVAIRVAILQQGTGTPKEDVLETAPQEEPRAEAVPLVEEASVEETDVEEAAL